MVDPALAAFQAAYDEALLAHDTDDVPVGAVIVKDGTVIARDHNRIIERHDPTAHAELLAIKKAADFLGNERLNGCDLYTTLEPCAMCTGAIILARIERVFFLNIDPKLPGLRAVLGLPGHNHYPKWQCVDLPDLPSGEILKQFFREKREQRKQRKQAGSENVPEN